MDEDEVIEAVVEAVRAELGRRGMVTTAVVVVAAAFEEDGEQALWVASDKGMPAWTSLGMLEYAAEQQRPGGGD